MEAEDETMRPPKQPRELRRGRGAARAARSRPQLAVAGVATALLMACPFRGLDEWNGEHIDYYTSPGLQVCGGTREYVDGFVPFVASELGLPIPKRVTYSWVDADDYGQTRCPGSGGCQLRRRAVGVDPALLHELVHVVTWGSHMNRSHFFSEGVAEVYDPFKNSLRNRYPAKLIGSSTLPDPREQLLAGDGELSYPLANGFAAFLLSRHGPGKLAAFMKKLRRRDCLGRIDRIFRDIYGLDLAAEAELFTVGADCPADPFPVMLYDCTMPEIPWASPLAWRYIQSMDCADENIVGGIGPDGAWPSLRSVTLEIPWDGTWELSISGEGDISAQLGACFGCPWDGLELGVSGTSGARTAELKAGTYYLRMRARSDESPDIVTVLRPG